MAAKNGKETLVLRVSEENFEAVLDRAAGIIRKGGTVAFPTETVYGLGADGLDPEAVKKIFEAKNRPPGNPLSLLIHSRADLEKVARAIPEKALLLMDAFWPGPLTLVLEKTDIVPPITSGNLSTIGVRMPDSPVPLELIKRAGVPLAAPSANLSGRPSPSSAAHVLADLDGRVDAVIDGGSVDIGLESTVVDMTAGVPTVLRPGAIGLEELELVVGEVKAGYRDAGEKEEGFEKKAGQKYGHYTPDTPVMLVEGEVDAVSRKIAELARASLEQGQAVGLLLSEEVSGCLSEAEVPADRRFLLGSRELPKEAAKRLFEGLRTLDEKKLDIILADGSFRDRGLGRAVLNRLREAASTRFTV